LVYPVVSPVLHDRQIMHPWQIHGHPYVSMLQTNC